MEMDTHTLGYVLVGLGAGLITISMLLKGVASRYVKRLEESNIPFYGRVKEGSTCPEQKKPHKWEKMILLDANSKQQLEHLVCLSCGLINGKGKQFGAHSLKLIQKKLEENAEVNSFFDSLEAHRKTRLIEEASFYDEQKDAFLAGFKFREDLDGEIAAKIKAREVRKALEALTEESEKLGLPF